MSFPWHLSLRVAISVIMLSCPAARPMQNVLLSVTSKGLSGYSDLGNAKVADLTYSK